MTEKFDANADANEIFIRTYAIMLNADYKAVCRDQ